MAVQRRAGNVARFPLYVDVWHECWRAGGSGAIFAQWKFHPHGLRLSRAVALNLRASYLTILLAAITFDYHGDMEHYEVAQMAAYSEHHCKPRLLYNADDEVSAKLPDAARAHGVSYQSRIVADAGRAYRLS